MDEAGTRLGTKLRRLRQQALNRPVTQRQLCGALGVSGALVGSWESGAAIPPEDRLRSYAHFFCTPRSASEGAIRMIPVEELAPDERKRRVKLFDELNELREEAIEETAGPVPAFGALGGRFLYYGDGLPVTVLCTPLSSRQLGYDDEAAADGSLPPAVQYATNPAHPNHVRNLANADVDALVELVGHLRAENPALELRWFTYDRVSSPDQLAGHLVLFGGIDEQSTELPAGSTEVVRQLRDRLPAPVRLVWDGEGQEFDAEFVVAVDADGEPTTDPGRVQAVESYRPDFLTDGQGGSGGSGTVDDRGRLLVAGAPHLVSDLALVQRTRNPFTPDATVTRFGGMFSRGTYGALRAFTDPRLRSRNERWLETSLDARNFWMLIQVPIIAGTVMTPDLDRSSTVLRSS
jgi:transcriptional regulator with XRE-family HTH domain